MRGFGVVACCVGILAVLSGCDTTTDYTYVREGIGTNLYWDGLPAATDLQDVYLSNICAQAVSPTARSVSAGSCDGLVLRPRDWGLLVQAGMNDIDLRCDAYLSWLHDKRSSREPILKELAVLGGATAAILKATEVSATPIALAGIAFGLAADSFTNADLRILNGVDYTTVQSVVRGNRADFRRDNLDLVIDNRPAAIYVLRNYLSLCVPASIEMSINNTLNVYHRSGTAGLEEQAIGLRTPVATSSTSASVRGVPIKATEPVVRQVRPVNPVIPEFADILDPYDPQTQSVAFVTGLQRAMCVPKNEVGAPGPITKALITIFEASPHPKTANNGKLDVKEISLIRGQGGCVEGGGRNYFEKLTYPINDPDGAEAVGQLIVALNKVPGGTQLALNTSLDGARDRIAQVRADPSISQKLKLQLPAALSNQVTRDFLLALPR